MKRKHPIIIGLIVIVVPILIGQVMTSKRDPQPLASIRKEYPKRPPNPILEKVIEEYDEKLNALMEKAQTPGIAVAIVHDSTIVYLKGIGVRSVNGPDSVDENTVFRLASVSKCFAAFLTGILVEDSVLSWNDHVSDYLPRFALETPEETQKLTIRNVLSHTTGLPYHTYTNMVEEGSPLDTMLSWLRNVRMASKVGKSYSYQNVAYSLVGPVIQAKTGKTYEQEMIQRVFIPLNMKTASIDYKSIMANANVAQPHLMRRGKKFAQVKINDTYYNVAPAGGINASISDMAQWMIALLGNRPNVIRKSTIDSLFTPVISAPSKNRNYGRMHRLSKSYYGMGWRILYYPNDTLMYHGGYVTGFRSEVAVNPRDKIAVCILANAPGEVADNGIPLFFDLFEPARQSVLRYEETQRRVLNRQAKID
ncbi:serine hydrolase domain-containing protein [Chryseolinea sp. T2]|uniref:serine hydrolase domain-containing protein n=1 Tax=Chryseolinea sp. T2 TaxID=3129255 RepID=UPI0030789DFB